MNINEVGQYGLDIEFSVLRDLGENCGLGTHAY